MSTVYNVGKIKEDTIPGGKIVSALSGSKTVEVSSIDSITDFSEKSNPSAPNNLNDSDAPKSKDDTIRDADYLNDRQRKEKRPDIDRDDVVFAEGEVSYSSRDIERVEILGVIPVTEKIL